MSPRFLPWSRGVLFKISSNRRKRIFFGEPLKLILAIPNSTKPCKARHHLYVFIIQRKEEFMELTQTLFGKKLPTRRESQEKETRLPLGLNFTLINCQYLKQNQEKKRLPLVISSFFACYLALGFTLMVKHLLEFPNISNIRELKEKLTFAEKRSLNYRRQRFTIFLVLTLSFQLFKLSLITMNSTILIVR